MHTANIGLTEMGIDKAHQIEKVGDAHTVTVIIMTFLYLLEIGLEKNCMVALYRLNQNYTPFDVTCPLSNALNYISSSRNVMK